MVFMKESNSRNQRTVNNETISRHRRRAGRHVAISQQEQVNSIDKKPAEASKPFNLKKKLGLVGLAAALGVGAYGFSVYKNMKQQITNASTIENVATELDHQGIVYNSLTVKNNEVITDIPVSGNSAQSYAFYTDILPNGQVELYQNLSTASGETRHIYPITDINSEHLAQAALKAVMGQSKK